MDAKVFPHHYDPRFPWHRHKISLIPYQQGNEAGEVIGVNLGIYPQYPPHDVSQSFLCGLGNVSLLLQK